MHVALWPPPVSLHVHSPRRTRTPRRTTSLPCRSPSSALRPALRLPCRSPSSRSPCSRSPPPALSVLPLCPLARHAPPPRFADAARSAPEYLLRRSRLPSARFLHAVRSPSSPLSPPPPSLLPMVTLPCHAGCPPSPSLSPAVSVCTSRPSRLTAHSPARPTECFFFCDARVLLRPQPGNARPIRQGRWQRTAGEAPGRPLPSLPSPFPRILLTPTRRHLQRTA